MKCSGKDCEEILSPNDKFCQACGLAADTIKCSGCGETLSLKSKFCSQCGRQVTHAQSSVQQKICTRKNRDGSSCGAELTLDSKFCSNCGNGVVTESGALSGASVCVVSVVQKDLNPAALSSDRFSGSDGPEFQHIEKKPNVQTTGECGIDRQPVSQICFPDDVNTTAESSTTDNSITDKQPDADSCQSNIQDKLDTGVERSSKQASSSESAAASDQSSVSHDGSTHSGEEHALDTASGPIPCSDDYNQHGSFILRSGFV